MVNRVCGAVIWLHLRHLESGRDQLIQDTLGESLSDVEAEIVGGLPIFHSESNELVDDFFEFTLVVI